MSVNYNFYLVNAYLTTVISLNASNHICPKGGKYTESQMKS